MSEKSDNTNLQEQSPIKIDEGMEKLDNILSQMKEGKGLEETFSLYKEGMDILASLNKQIDAVENEVLILSGDGQVQPFVHADDSDMPRN